MNASTTTMTVRDADTIWHEEGRWFDARIPLEFEPIGVWAAGR